MTRHSLCMGAADDKIQFMHGSCRKKSKLNKTVTRGHKRVPYLNTHALATPAGRRVLIMHGVAVLEDRALRRLVFDGGAVFHPLIENEIEMPLHRPVPLYQKVDGTALPVAPDLQPPGLVNL